jgi:PelA/Pel-15E family pectate lyase
MRIVLIVLCVLAAIGGADAQTVEGHRVVWHPISISFEGPTAAQTDDSPNPFLDLRLQVAFNGPDNQLFVVPGFFDGDGKCEAKGNVWRARFSPNLPGEWRYEASFRKGSRVAIELAPEAGEPIAFPNTSGRFEIAPRDPDAPGFLKWGRLNYVGQHYLKFQDGSFWLRGGIDEPENFLAYAGFDRTPKKHRYADHEADWQEGDPDWGEGRGRAIIGALNYLANQHVNSIYFLTMNVGGDGNDVWPWTNPIDPRGSHHNDNFHFDVSKLGQWETVFAHAQRRGIFLHFVFNEAEAANKRELDDGELGPERKLYYREMVARFGHHPALEWNLCEEYNLNFDFGPGRLRAFADYIRAIDPYDHPIAVHSAGDPVEALRFSYGDSRFGLTSVQLNQRPIHEVTEAIRQATRQAGRPLPVSLDEFTLDRGQRASHIPVDDAAGHRREKIWPTYFSGGMIEIILDDLLRTDSFKKGQREQLWRYLWIARHFMEQNLPFWEMEPADHLSRGAATVPVGIGDGKSVALGPQVFAKPGDIYAVYLPTGESSGTIDLTDLSGEAERRWFNPRSGEFVGSPARIEGGAPRFLGQPPSEHNDDWVVLIDRIGRQKFPPISVAAFRDGSHHWRKFRDPKRVIHVLPDQATYLPEQVEQIAANILRYQRANGGWPKDYDMLAILTPDQLRTLEATRDRTDTSFDNYNIHSQVEYLAKAYAAGENKDWRRSCERGLDFMLSAQLASGGFPQQYPDADSYAAHITFNDGVTIGILNLLHDIATNAPHWKWLDHKRRLAAKEAVDRGTACILKCQIVDGDVRKGWCQQHDEKTFAAASARTFELASVCPQETTTIVRFLMRIEAPDERIVESIEDAVAWLRRVQLHGVRVQRIPAPETDYGNHTENFDIVVVADDAVPPIWARHYEIESDRPVFAGRDAIKRYSLNEIERERRTGTPWYGNWPTELIEREYPLWRKKVLGGSLPP